MCGIFGVIQKSVITDAQKVLYQNGLEILHHRGPDATWVFANDHVFFWHKRLSIIDTRSCANQPFVYDKYNIIFNGEIYNFKILKQELMTLGHTFTTESDTEVLVHAYQQWWQQCTEKFDGMWAFAIYDTISWNIFLSRDRIGEKPLLYYKDEDRIIFGSEIPSILACLNKKEITPYLEALANFNTYNFKHIPAPFTAFKWIYKLKPGYCLTVNSKTLDSQEHKYFAIESVKIENDPVEQFISIFSASVEQSCYADVPVGILLSWGIDSSLIAAMLKGRNIMTYSLGYDGNDPELIRAKAIAAHLWLQNKQIYFKDYVTKDTLINLVKENIHYLGEPINLFPIIYSDMLLKEMKKDGIKVVIGGNGADELFYGYDGMNRLLQISNWKKHIDTLHITPKVFQNDNLKALIYRYFLWKKTYIHTYLRKFLYTAQIKEYAHEIPSKNLIDIFSWLGLRMDNEHSITMIADLSWAKNSMEIRSPFLNKNIIDFAASLPIEYKVISTHDKKHNKYILKKALERYLPPELVYQKKMWFGYSIKPLDIIWDIPSIDIPQSIIWLYNPSDIRNINTQNSWEQFLLNMRANMFL